MRRCHGSMRAFKRRGEMPIYCTGGYAIARFFLHAGLRWLGLTIDVGTHTLFRRHWAREIDANLIDPWRLTC